METTIGMEVGEGKTLQATKTEGPKERVFTQRSASESGGRKRWDRGLHEGKEMDRLK